MNIASNGSVTANDWLEWSWKETVLIGPCSRVFGLHFPIWFFYSIWRWDGYEDE